MMMRVVGVVMGIALAQPVFADCSSDLVDSINARCTNTSNVNNDEVCKMGKMVNAFNSWGIYGSTDQDYVRVISICDPNTNNGQPCLDVNNTPSTHDVVTLTVATDASFIQVHGQEMLDGSKGRYQCGKAAFAMILGAANVIETAPVALKIENAPPAENPPKEVPQVAVDCHSEDFDCESKTSYSLPIGEYCRTSTVDLGQQEKLLWVEGSKAAFIFDSRTRKAVLCKEANTCGKSGGFYPAGKDADGSHLMIVFEGDGGKLKLLSKNVAGMFRKLLAIKGKGMAAALSEPVVEDCEAIKILMQDDLGKAGDITEKEAPLIAELEKIFEEIPFSKDKEAVAAKFSQIAKDNVGDESFGKKLLDQINFGAGQQAKPGIVMHKIEGFGDRPNAIIVDVAGGYVFREAADHTVLLDPDDILPGAREYVLADLDNYGGKDLIGFTDDAIILLPKKNLPPQIDQLSLTPDAMTQKAQAQVVTRTQDGEDLSYKWRVFEFKEGQLTERPDLISSATAAAPTLNFPTDSVATAQTALPTESAIAVAPADVGVNAALSKSLGVRKDVASSAQPVYFVSLTATDPGNLSATSYAAISKTVGGVAAGPGTPLVPGTTVPAQPTTFPNNATLGGSFGSLFGFEGGCSLIRR